MISASLWPVFLANYSDDWELIGTADSGWPISFINELETWMSTA